ncbi:MAG: hypothetical protein JWO98_5279 [Frankiales bacterium]|nr:hypothetical protein [Frankiales bacterium]
MSCERSLLRAVADGMIGIPAGEIVLRNEGTSATWPVQVAAFRLALHPVTRELYRTVVEDASANGAGPRTPITEVAWLDAVRFCNLLSRASGLQPCYTMGEDPDGLDVVCDWAVDGYRLPSEAEWEHAARADSCAIRYGDLDEIGLYRGNSGDRVHDVATKAPSTWGLYDMIGNVWEWCWASSILAFTARTACSAAAAGRTSLGDAVHRAAARATRPSASTISGSGSPARGEADARSGLGIIRRLLRQRQDRVVLVPHAGRTNPPPALEHPHRAGQRDARVPRDLAQPAPPAQRPGLAVTCRVRNQEQDRRGLRIPGARLHGTGASRGVCRTWATSVRPCCWPHAEQVPTVTSRGQCCHPTARPAQPTRLHQGRVGQALHTPWPRSCPVGVTGLGGWLKNRCACPGVDTVERGGLDA